MQSIIKMYNPFTDFIMPKNKDIFWVRGGMHIRQNLSLLKELHHPLWQNPTLENRHKTP